jgi:hypothetical protein
MGNALLMSRTISGQRWPDEPEAAVPNRPDNLLQLESLVLEDLALLSAPRWAWAGQPPVGVDDFIKASATVMVSSIAVSDHGGANTEPKNRV